MMWPEDANRPPSREEEMNDEEFTDWFMAIKHDSVKPMDTMWCLVRMIQILVKTGHTHG